MYIAVHQRLLGNECNYTPVSTLQQPNAEGLTIGVLEPSKPATENMRLQTFPISEVGAPYCLRRFKEIIIYS